MLNLSMIEIVVVIAVALSILPADEIGKLVKGVINIISGCKSSVRELLLDIEKEDNQDSSTQITQVTKQIKGDDGNLYEAYDISDLLPDKQQDKSE